MEFGGGHLRRIAASGEEPPILTALARSLVLARGEREALQLALGQPELILLTDDAAARLAAEALRIRVHGSIGVLLRAVRLGRRTREQVLETLSALNERCSLHVRPALLAEVIESLRSR